MPPSACPPSPIFLAGFLPSTSVTFSVTCSFFFLFSSLVKKLRRPPSFLDGHKSQGLHRPYLTPLLLSYKKSSSQSGAISHSFLEAVGKSCYFCFSSLLLFPKKSARAWPLLFLDASERQRRIYIRHEETRGKRSIQISRRSFFLILPPPPLFSFLCYLSKHVFLLE